MILGINREADGGPSDPMVWQRLRPIGVDHEYGRLSFGRLDGPGVTEELRCDSNRYPRNDGNTKKQTCTLNVSSFLHNVQSSMSRLVNADYDRGICNLNEAHEHPAADCKIS